MLETWKSLTFSATGLGRSRRSHWGPFLSAGWIIDTYDNTYQESVILLVIADSIMIYCGGGVHGVAFMHPSTCQLVQEGGWLALALTLYRAFVNSITSTDADAVCVFFIFLMAIIYPSLYAQKQNARRG